MSSIKRNNTIQAVQAVQYQPKSLLSQAAEGLQTLVLNARDSTRVFTHTCVKAFNALKTQKREIVGVLTASGVIYLAVSKKDKAWLTEFFKQNKSTKHIGQAATTEEQRALASTVIATKATAVVATVDSPKTRTSPKTSKGQVTSGDKATKKNRKGKASSK